MTRRAMLAEAYPFTSPSAVNKPETETQSTIAREGLEMTTTERDLLLGMAEALYLLLHHEEESRLSYAWKHSTMPSDRLADLITSVQKEAARDGRKAASIAHVFDRAAE